MSTGLVTVRYEELRALETKLAVAEAERDRLRERVSELEDANGIVIEHRDRLWNAADRLIQRAAIVPATAEFLVENEDWLMLRACLSAYFEQREGEQ